MRPHENKVHETVWTESTRQRAAQRVAGNRGTPKTTRQLRRVQFPCVRTTHRHRRDSLQSRTSSTPFGIAFASPPSKETDAPKRPANFGGSLFHAPGRPTGIGAALGSPEHRPRHLAWPSARPCRRKPRLRNDPPQVAGRFGWAGKLCVLCVPCGQHPGAAVTGREEDVVRRARSCPRHGGGSRDLRNVRHLDRGEG